MASPLSPGTRLAGRYRVGEALEAPPDLARHAVIDEQAPADVLEAVTLQQHARMRPGAREAFLAAEAEPPRGLRTVAVVDDPRFPVRIRERVAMIATEALLGELSSEEGARLHAWLGADARLEAQDLAIDLLGLPRLAPRGLPVAQRLVEPRPMSSLLAAPGHDATAPRIVLAARALARDPSESHGLARLARPAFVVTVALPDDPVQIERISTFTGLSRDDVRRAARAGKSWPWAVSDHPAIATRARILGGRLDLAPELVAIAVVPPSFVGTAMAALGTQFPFLVGTGIPAVDFSLAAGLGLASAVSLVSNARRLRPYRRAQRALGALDLARAASPRAPGVESSLLQLASALQRPAVPEVVRADAHGALDEAWMALLSEPLPLPDPRRESLRLSRHHEVAAAAQALGEALGEPGPALVAAVDRLRRVSS
ncbi:MAG: hypothetical protein FJ102_07500 [Deltaproteobacteria bacterium]|nr:hypothetical protein [Deltaproteobacteria bacterium]